MIAPKLMCSFCRQMLPTIALATLCVIVGNAIADDPRSIGNKSDAQANAIHKPSTNPTSPKDSNASPQAIGTPRYYYLVVIDRSVSMGNPSSDGKLSGGFPSTKMTDVLKQLEFLKANLPDKSRIHFYCFDKSLERGPELTVGLPDSGKAMQAYFAGIKPTGNATYLWSSLDSVLDDATHLAIENSSATIRLLLLTDGEDNDPSQPNPEKILTKHSEYLKSQIRLNYVTLGFEVQANLRKILESHHARVSAAMSPDTIIPLEAAFRLLPNESELGQEIAVVDESIGIVRQRIVDWGDGSPRSDSRSPSHIYLSAGEYTVKLAIKSSTGLISQAQQQVVIRKPPPPKAMFILTENEIDVGHTTTLIDQSTGPIDQRQWKISDGRSFNGALPKISFPNPGNFDIELTIIGPAGSDTSKNAIVVRPPSRPQAGFTLGTDTPQLGDTLVVVDTSKGPVDRIFYTFNGQAEIVIDRSEMQDERTVKLPLSQAGKLIVRQVCSGPGGVDECSKTIAVSHRAEPPVAAIATDYQTTPGPVLIALKNESTGTIHKSKYEFSDGSDPLVVDGKQSIQHRFEPGSHRVVLTTYGHADFAPSVDDINFNVGRPIPKFVWHLAWIVPISLLALAVSVLLLRSRALAHHRLQQSLLKGQLEIFDNHRSHMPLISRALLGTSREESIDIDDDTVAVIRSQFDAMNHCVKYRLELIRYGALVTSDSIEPDAEVESGGLVFRLTT